jgi:type IV secretory pathway VirB10-like protein
MPQREAILSIVAQIAPDKVDAVAAALPQPSPRRRKSGTLVRHERDEALVEEWRRQQALQKAARELERRELQRESGRVTIFVYDERIKFRKIPAPTARHPVPAILSGRVRAGKARIVKYVITLDENYELRTYDWSALLKKHSI